MVSCSGDLQVFVGGTVMGFAVQRSLFFVFSGLTCLLHCVDGMFVLVEEALMRRLLHCRRALNNRPHLAYNTRRKPKHNILDLLD
jgi:hypothetical protein